MPQQIFIVDAFASAPFEGNPAAVVPLSHLEPEDPWPDDTILQAAAAEHNLSETAFLRPLNEAQAWALRWFTPAAEVPLCGHATLAAGHVALAHLSGGEADAAFFDTASGRLTVVRDGGHYAMALPVLPRRDWSVTAEVCDTLGVQESDVVAAFAGRYPTIVLANAAGVEAVAVADAMAVAMGLGDVAAENGCLTVTAATDVVDEQKAPHFIARFFAPGVGIPEDPVTGSMFCDTGPYWCEKLGKPELHGFQASARGGHVRCRYTPKSDQVTLIGGVVEYLRGEIVV